MKIPGFLSDPKFSGLIQFVKFGIVGLSNTVISYGIDMLCYYVILAPMAWPSNVKIIVASVLAFVISVTNSYYWNNRYVFSSGERKTLLQHLLAYVRVVVCYAFTGLLLAPALRVWMNDLGLPYWLSGLACLVVTIPLNFVMNKFWAFGDRRG